MADPVASPAVKAKGGADVTMAEAQDPTAAGSSNIDHTLKRTKDALFQHCAAQPEGTIFTQDDLLRTFLIPENNPKTLLTVTNALMQEELLKLMTKSGVVCWRVIASNSTAPKGLDEDAQVVWEHIASSGREGIWSGVLSKKVRLHKGVMDKAIKFLEKERHIKTVQHHRHPHKKTYMLWRLQPFDDVTGGPFFSDGDLDEEFVRVMLGYVGNYVRARSWWSTKNSEREIQSRKRKHHRTEAPATTEDAEAQRALAMDPRGQLERQGRRPFPAGYSKYPAVPEITDALNGSEISHAKLKYSDMQSLVDLLVWDGQFERLKRRDRKGNVKFVYRAAKSPFVEEPTADGDIPTTSTALTEAPCGRCPVFEFCEEGGLVSARTCPYFQEWLKF